MKIKGYIKQYRYDFLMRLKSLTDQEMRLYQTHVLLANWDRKNKETFGKIIGLSVRKIREKYLKWSVGKISDTRKSLVLKGFLKPLPEGGYLVENYWIYQASARQAEQAFQCDEQGIHPTEQNVRENEQGQVNELKQSKDNLVQKLSILQNSVQPNEHNLDREK
jgi:hypothetical protein